MKRRILMLGLVSVLLLALSSCSGYRHVSGVRTFTDANYRLNTNLDDYTMLGETEVSVEWRTYLGVFNFIDKVNDVLYNKKDYKVVSLEGMMQAMSFDSKIDKALYKVLEEYPDADFYMPVSNKTEVQQLFLGKHRVETVRIKAFKLN